jgi:histone H1/5
MVAAKKENKTKVSKPKTVKAAKEGDNKPKYTEMVVKAAKAIGGRNGASRVALKNWVVKEFKLTQDTAFNKRLNQALSKLVDAGKVSQVLGKQKFKAVVEAKKEGAKNVKKAAAQKAAPKKPAEKKEKKAAPAKKAAAPKKAVKKTEKKPAAKAAPKKAAKKAETSKPKKTVSKKVAEKAKGKTTAKAAAGKRKAPAGEKSASKKQKKQ